MYQSILVALDGSDLAERVLPHVEALASQFGSTIVLFRSTTEPEAVIAQTAPAGAGMGAMTGFVDPTPIIEAEERETREYLHGIAARLRGRGLNVREDIHPGPAAAAILKRAHDLNVDLIAMTTHGRGGLGRIVFGSVAEEVLRRSDCPLLLVRVHKPED